MNELYLAINIVFVQNLALGYGLGLLPVLRKGQAFGFGWASFARIIAPLFVAGIAAWGLNQIFSVLLDLSFLRTLIFALLLIGILQGLRSIGARNGYQIFTQQLGAASTLMAVMALAGSDSLSIVSALVVSASAALGYGLALAIHAGILSRMELDWIPKAFRGLPISLIGLGFVSLVFVAVSAVLAPAIGGGQ